MTHPYTRRALVAAAAATTVLVAAQTQAGPILTPSGWAAPAPGNETFTVHVGTLGLSETVSVGGFIGTWGPDTILFWCYELNEYFGFGNAYDDYTATTVSDPVANAALSELFTEVGGSGAATSTDDRSAAFQLAVWEIKYDTGGPYNLGGGNFTVDYDPANVPNAVTIAQGWLAALSPPQSYTITLLSSPGNADHPGHQDFIMGSALPRLEAPEPSPLPLLGTGVLAMVFAWRGRRRCRA